MHPRLRAGLVIAAVVIASAIAGAAIDRSLMARYARRDGGDRRRPPTPELESRRRTEMLDRMSRDLSLSPAQRAGLDSVFQRTDSSLRAIRREMQPRLQQVFESSRAEMNARLDSTQRAKLARMKIGRPPGQWGEGRGGPGGPRP
jgi:Spy/CpxP family protein refolding chaperone